MYGLWYRLTLAARSTSTLSAWASRQQQVSLLVRGDAALERAHAAAVAAWNKGVVSRHAVLDTDAQLLRNADARVQAQMELALAAVGSVTALGGAWSAPDAAQAASGGGAALALVATH